MSAPVIALFGGSFDPPHLGHVLAVSWALSAAAVDGVWVVPTWKHAFDKEHAAAFEDRMAMCELAFAPFRGVTVSPIERELGGISRTLETIEALHERHPGSSFRLLVGADVLPTTSRWHRWEAVARMAPPIVVGREGYPLSPDCPISIPDINSTELRRRTATGASLDGFVPSSVARYIEERGLYQGAS